MADKKETSDTPAADKNAPSIQVLTQYVKDCSFENPNAPESLISGWNAPDTSVQISLSKTHVKDNLFESALHFRVEAKNTKSNKMAFIIDLHYGALVALQNIPEENIQAVLMVEVPKMLFPFVREMVASMTAKGGYPPLYLTPISFEAMYVSEMKRLKTETGKQAGRA